jgi:hypothetical protein
MSDSPNDPRPTDQRDDELETDDLDPEQVVDDAVELFEAPYKGPPIADTDVPAPPG